MVQSFEVLIETVNLEMLLKPKSRQPLQFLSPSLQTTFSLRCCWVHVTLCEVSLTRETAHIHPQYVKLIVNSGANPITQNENILLSCSYFCPSNILSVLSIVVNCGFKMKVPYEKWYLTELCHVVPILCKIAVITFHIYIYQMLSVPNIA